MRSLREKQARFTVKLARLVQFAESLGYELTLGESYRPPETAALYATQGKGIAQSLHTLRLAQDYNLFKDGVYLTRVADWRVLGEFWESLSEPDLECCWGGRFTSGDANHVSLAHGGRK